MRSASATFNDAITRSHVVAVQVDVLTDSEIVDTITTAIDGTVTLDGKAAIRGRCDLTITDDGTLGLTPAAPTDLLAPYGNELRVSRGIRYADDTEEVVPLGVFRIEQVTVNEGSIQIAGQDRAARITDARFEFPYQVASGTNYTTAIQTVLQDAWPSIPLDLTSTTRTTPQLIAEDGSDRWAFAQSMASSIGMVLYFDGDGTCVMRPVTSGSGSVLSLVEGEDGVLIAATRTWVREGAFNRVITTGENTGAGTPARGIATDDNPNSPTYYYGPFGQVPRFYASPFITNEQQADDAAEAILTKELGTTQTVTFGAVVDPRLEPDDVVRITRAVSGIDEDHVVDTLTIPLGVTATLTGQTRARVVT